MYSMSTRSQFDVTWDPRRYAGQLGHRGQFSAIGRADYFDGGTVDNSAGTIAALQYVDRGNPGASGTGVVATISFTPVAEGYSAVQFANLLVLDSSLNDAGVVGTDGRYPLCRSPGRGRWWLAIGAWLCQRNFREGGYRRRPDRVGRRGVRGGRGRRRGLATTGPGAVPGW